MIPDHDVPPRPYPTMQRHRLLSGAGLLACYLLACACGARGPMSASGGSLGRTVSTRGTIEIDHSGPLPDRVEELLIGRFPGVNVVRISGERFQVRIRATSMQGTQDPLWVVDGLPVEPAASYEILGTIEPRQVSRIVVLKDAGSTAMYGTRGANGVIEVTTRRGAITEPTFPTRPPSNAPPRSDAPSDPDV